MAIWAAAAIYTVATIYFLFDKSLEPHIPSSDIFNYFDTSSSTVSQKAAQIHTILKFKQYWDSDFSTGHMQANNPFDLM